MSASTPPSSQAPNSFPTPDEPARKHLERRKGLTAIIDAEIWGDPVIIESERQQWRSAAYDHYKAALGCHFDILG
ncbi:hypothetical protein FRC12_003020 [Ceratobasidium sp. 428]|nr:hypothetical protein FRC12_003020 [Ceratobasidium sp. 428]